MTLFTSYWSANAYLEPIFHHPESKIMLISKKTCNGLSDREIVARALLEVDFFSCLYERYESPLLRYIARLGVNQPEEARDILQDSFIKIWKNLHGFDPRLKLSSWIYRIVHNEVVSVLRKKQSYGKDQTTSLENLGYLKAVASSTDATKEEAATMDFDQSLKEVLKELPLKYREVLVLKFLEMKNYEEISDILRIPEGTVGTRINRAKKAFLKVSKEKSIHFEY